jgi:hypothetical protein
MKYISHRGNINGKLESWENEPTYIDLAITKGYDVEIDVWYKNNMLWLGHDKPEYSVDFKWFVDRISKLWVHCKNIEAVNFFNSHQYKFNYFWHENDTITLTSLNYIWAYPGKQPIKDSIAVMPEIYNDDVKMSIGICSDVIEKYKTL